MNMKALFAPQNKFGFDRNWEGKCNHQRRQCSHFCAASAQLGTAERRHWSRRLAGGLGCPSQVLRVNNSLTNGTEGPVQKQSFPGNYRTILSYSSDMPLAPISIERKIASGGTTL